MWFMGALPAPADANPLTHLFKKAAHVAVNATVHIGKGAASARCAGPAAKVFLRDRAATNLATSTVHWLRR